MIKDIILNVSRSYNPQISSQELWGLGSTANGALDDNIGRSFFIQVQSGSIWVSASMGDTHAIAIKSDGTLWGWGQNTSGELGVNDFTNRSSPVQIGTRTDWTSISSGYSFNVATRSDGTLWSWGFNPRGQLGLGDLAYRSSPTQIGTLTNWLRADTSQYIGEFAMAIKTDGTLWGWGDHLLGQLGWGSSSLEFNTINADTWVSQSTGRGAGSAQHAMLIKSDGTLWGWGVNGNYQVGDGTGIDKSSPVQIGTRTWYDVSAGANYTIAVRSDNTLWGWGNQGSTGNLGNNSRNAITLSPVQVGTLNNWSKVYSSNTNSFTIAIKSDGTMWSWSNNQNGQLGDGTVVSKSSPVQIGTLNNWSIASANGATPLALKTDGTLWAWGYNAIGQVGDGTSLDRSSPVQIGTRTWTSITTTQSVSLAIRSDGTLWAWGDNGNGELGGNLSQFTRRSSPVQIGTRTWNAVFGGRSTVHAIRSDGTLWAWGLNSSGEYGNFVDKLSRSSPVQIGTRTDWKMFDGGESFTMAMDSTGLVYTISARALQLGRPSQFSSPVQIGTRTNWTNISCGFRNGIGIAGGSIFTWGDNTVGQIGNNNNTTYGFYSPVQIGTRTDWIRVNNANQQMQAIRAPGSLWAWGYNLNGQLGDNTSTNRSSPVQIGTRSDWIFADTDADTSIGLRSDNTLWAWGRTTVGAFGNGIDTFSRSSPVQIGTTNNWKAASITTGVNSAIDINGGLFTVGSNTIKLGYGLSYSSPKQLGNRLFWRDVAAGDFHSLAISGSGHLFSFGDNAFGQIGDNTVDRKISPVQIGTLNNWRIVKSGKTTSYSIKTNNTLWSWGENTNGQLGLNTLTTQHRSSPVQIGTRLWNEISSYVDSVGAIRTDGTIWTWGNDTSGMLGLNTNSVSRSSPTQIGTLTNWSKITVALSNMASVKTDGTLWTWGANSQGQLGDGTVTVRSSPVQIGTLNNWLNVFGGEHAIFATKTDGTLWGWGSDNSSQLGIASNTLVPNLVPNHSFTKVFAGINFNNPMNLALKSDGTLWSWGNNSTNGLLGFNDKITRSSPTQIGTRTWSNISVGNNVAMAVRSDGTLWIWGSNTGGQLGLGDLVDRSSPVQVGTLNNWSEISAGWSHTMAIKTDGTLWGWGNNQFGQLGLDKSLLVPNYVNSLEQFSKIYNGSNYTLALKSTGTLWGWGDNSFGNLGLGDSVTRSSPVQIGTRIWNSVHTNVGTSLAISDTGTLWSWGGNVKGQLGLNDTVNRSSPVQVGTLNNWSQVSAGTSHTMAIKTDGTLWGWGSQESGALGNGSSILNISSPVQIGTLNNWKFVSAGGNSSFAIKTDNTLWGWGGIYAGNNSTSFFSSPVQIGTRTWNTVSTSNGTVLAIRSDGTLWAWGQNNFYGQFGTNNVTVQSSPVQVGTRTDWSDIDTSTSATGGSLTVSVFGLTSNNALWSWGYNQEGSLGLNDTVNRSSPVQVGTLNNWASGSVSVSTATLLDTNGYALTIGTLGAGFDTNFAIPRSSPVQIGTLNNWKSVSVGSFHTIAIDNDNKLWSWGTNGLGQLGLNLGLTAHRSSPVQVGTLNNWSQVSAGISHTMAIQSTGTLWGWGSNASGRLGLGNQVTHSSPVQVGTLSNWKSVSSRSGDASSVAIKTDGTLWSWGTNTNSRLGLGNTVDRSSPVQVGDANNWVSASISNHGTALNTNGSLYVWSSQNGSGELGFTPSTGGTRSSPVQIGTQTNWSGATIIPNRSSTVFAIKTDGTLWGWGLNSSRQLVLGDTINRSFPVLVNSQYNWVSGSGVGEHLILIRSYNL